MWNILSCLQTLHFGLIAASVFYGERKVKTEARAWNNFFGCIGYSMIKIFTMSAAGAIGSLMGDDLAGKIAGSIIIAPFGWFPGKMIELALEGRKLMPQEPKTVYIKEAEEVFAAAEKD